MPAAPDPSPPRPAPRRRTEPVAPGEEHRDHVNELRLRGRLAAGSIERPLPSGDVIATFRLIVERPAVRRGGAAGARVDTLDCVVHLAAARRRVARWGAGDVIEVHGSLRRRFFRVGGSTASRYEVEATNLTRVARAGVTERGTMAG